MFRLFLVTMFWTLLLSLPLTALGVLGLGIMTTHGINMFAWLIGWASQISYVGMTYSVEIMGRMPEVAGMAAGMLVILITVWIAREPSEQSEYVTLHK